MTDLPASFTAIAVRARDHHDGSWVELDDAPMTLKEARCGERKGLLVMAQRRDAELDVIVVKAARDVPKKVLDWRRKGDA